MSNLLKGNIIMIFSLFGLGHAYAQSTVYDAFVANDLGKWKQHIDVIEQQNPSSNQQLLSLVNYQYGYIGWCLREKQDNEAEKYLNKLGSNLQKLEKRKYKTHLINAYWSAYYGFKVRLNRLKAPYYGPKSVNYSNKAVEENANHWFILMQQANIENYMPSIFGGSNTKAISYYVKARKQMEKNPKLISGNWNYLNLLITIAETYTELEKYELAEAYYKKILNIEPGIRIVKDELYPTLRKKRKIQ
jgi:tetratricopeptide (TPR) repeat protein